LEVAMPPRGVSKGSKRERQYEHVKDSERAQGASEGRAKEIAARTVNKQRARAGESRTSSRISTDEESSGRRGGPRSGRAEPRGRTRDQLYEEARPLGIKRRSTMRKAELERAVDAKRGRSCRVRTMRPSAPRGSIAAGAASRWRRAVGSSPREFC
jgi:hypothetical protein